MPTDWALKPPIETLPHRAQERAMGPRSLADRGVAHARAGRLGTIACAARPAPGVRVRLGPPLRIDLYLGIARGVPVAEVARNVDTAVRYAVRQAVGRDVDELAIHVDRLGLASTRRPAADEPPVAAMDETTAETTETVETARQ